MTRLSDQDPGLVQPLDIFGSGTIPCRYSTTAASDRSKESQVIFDRQFGDRQTLWLIMLGQLMMLFDIKVETQFAG